MLDSVTSPSLELKLRSSDDSEHSPAVSDFVHWCNSSFLDINVAKTKEMCIDFRKNSPLISPVVMDSQAVELVQQYKHLGTVIDNKLCFELQVDVGCTIAHQCMQFYHQHHLYENVLFLFY